MENYKKNHKKRNNKLLYTLSGFLLVFGVFIYILLKPSVESLAIDDLHNANTVEEVRSLWEKNKGELADDQEYVDQVRTRLSSFHLSAQQTGACLKWLPKPPQSLNLIIVPDLSGRINDGTNNPGQIQNDTALLNEVWRSFEAATRLKMNSSDRLLVDVTGGNQAQGQFRSIANDLFFDLSDFKDKSYKLYFTKTGSRFQNNIAELYRLAQNNPQGADYWSYFNHDLKRNIRTSTLFTDYRNLLIILTDGYLEAQTKQATGTALYTGTYQQRADVFNKLKAGYTVSDAVSTITPIMDCSDHFENLEVLILEVNARRHKSPQEPNDPGTPRDFDILRKLWTDWLSKLEVKNASTDFFNERLNANELTKQKIRDFVKGTN
jgi:hypothetical protein